MTCSQQANRYWQAGSKKKTPAAVLEIDGIEKTKARIDNPAAAAAETPGESVADRASMVSGYSHSSSYPTLSSEEASDCYRSKMADS